jgi:putative transposase
MAHSYICNHIHYVFSTKNRVRNLPFEIRGRLWSYMGGIAKQHDIMPIMIGGHDDHCHALVSLPSTIPVAKAVQHIKAFSSKWLSETFPELRTFQWQDGYGAFGVGISQLGDTIRYIQNQEEHHKRMTFQEEYVAFLKRHNIPYDERYVVG